MNQFFGGWVDEPFEQLAPAHRCLVRASRLAKGGWYWVARCQYEGCHCVSGDVTWVDVIDWAISHARWNRRVKAA